MSQGPTVGKLTLIYMAGHFVPFNLFFLFVPGVNLLSLEETLAVLFWPTTIPIVAGSWLALWIVARYHHRRIALFLDRSVGENTSTRESFRSSATFVSRFYILGLVVYSLTTSSLILPFQPFVTPVQALILVLTTLIMVLTSSIPFFIVYLEALGRLIAPRMFFTHWSFSLRYRLFIGVVFTVFGTVLLFFLAFLIQSYATTSKPLFLPIHSEIFLTIAALTIASFNFFFLSRSVMRSISLSERSVSLVASGDFRNSQPAEALDELGQLIDSLGQMSSRLSGSLGTVSGVGLELQTTGEGLVGASKIASGSLDDISLSVNSIRSQVTSQNQAVGETSETIAEILRNLADLNRLVETQASNVTESSASIELMVSNIQAVTRTVDQLGITFGQLKAVSEEGKNNLESMITIVHQIASQSENLQSANLMVKSIASQTNLLAMNAAIEAAHAGDSGRGFAVVADEIRKLAELSSLQSKDISQDIKSMRDQIDSIARVSFLAESSFGQILQEIQVVGSFEAEMRRAMVEQSSANNQVLEAVSEINRITQEVQRRSVDMVAGSETVDSIMNRLTRNSEEVRTSVEMIAEKNVGIQRIFEQIKGLSDVNRKQALRLETEMAQFHIAPKA